MSLDTFEELNELVWGFQRARMLLTAVELDLFTAVGHGGSAAEVAAKCRTDPRATEALLNALTADDLLIKSGDRFLLSEVAREHLTAESPEDGRPALNHHAHLWRSWSQLTDCVKHGTKAAVDDRDTPQNRDFIGAMHVYAEEQSAAFVAALDLRNASSLLDLGGGSGAYAIAFCRKYPDLRATVFDKKDILPITRDYIDAAGMTSRVTLLSGDMLEDDLGGPYDVAWVSNVVHAYGPDNIRRCFGKVCETLKPGGRLILRDFIMDDSKTNPSFAALFALNMLVATGEGGSYSEKEYRGWMEEAGLREITPMAVKHSGNTRLLIGKRPE